MLTEPCVMFFSPLRVVLSAISRDEYLTSAVRTKEGDKAGRWQFKTITIPRTGMFVRS